MEATKVAGLPDDNAADADDLHHEHDHDERLQSRIDEHREQALSDSDPRVAIVVTNKSDMMKFAGRWKLACELVMQEPPSTVGKLENWSRCSSGYLKFMNEIANYTKLELRLRQEKPEANRPDDASGPSPDIG